MNVPKDMNEYSMTKESQGQAMKNVEIIVLLEIALINLYVLRRELLFRQSGYLFIDESFLVLA